MDKQLQNHYVALTKKKSIATASVSEAVSSSSTSEASFDRRIPRPAHALPTCTKNNSHVMKTIAKRKADYPWLMPVEGGALCEFCSKFYYDRPLFYCDRPLPSNNSDMFVKKPFNNWHKSTGTEPKNNKLLKHHHSAIHSTATAFHKNHLTATAFHKNGQQMSVRHRTVYSLVKKQSKEEQLFQLERLIDFADTALYLFKSEIPHTTHFDSLLALVARLDGSNQILNFMNASPDNATYDSKATSTELLAAVSQWLTTNILNRARSSQFIAILADESTDIRTRNELSLCLRFVENGDAIETFLRLEQVKSTQAETIKDAIKIILKNANIPLERVFWMAFDGAANMSSRLNDVQAKLKCELLTNAHYIHCRSHLLNLAAANVARDIKPLQGIFSSFNSLWKFFHNSPLRHNKLVEVKQVLHDPILELVRVGDTRWTSNYRAVRAVRASLESIVIHTDIHTAAGDLSSEAGGLLLTFQDQTSILLIHAIEQILQPINILTWLCSHQSYHWLTCLKRYARCLKSL